MSSCSAGTRAVSLEIKSCFLGCFKLSSALLSSGHTAAKIGQVEVSSVAGRADLSQRWPCSRDRRPWAPLQHPAWK